MYMEEFSLAKFLGITEEELHVIVQANTVRREAEEAKLQADIAEMRKKPPEEIAEIWARLAEDMKKPPRMPTHGTNY